MIQPRAMAVSLRLIRGTVAACAILLAECGGSSGPVTYTVRASVSGLSGSGLILQLNGGDDLTVTANGNSTFATPVTPGMSYQVTVKTQPSSPRQVCTVGNGSGTINAGNATVTISCATVHTIGVSVSGLSGTGLVLQLNGGNDLPIMANGPATFSGAIGSGARYAVAVGTQPSFPAQICSVANGSGTVGTADVNGITITCVTSIAILYSFTGGGGVTGADYEFVDGSTYRYVIYGITTTGRRALTVDIGADLSRQTHLVQTSDGSLYGTTNGGGAYGLGTVFKAKPDVGTIYSFGGVSSDALAPGSPMIQGSDGNLYGTTATGGSPSATCPKGCGTVFRVTPSGVETVLYSFGSKSTDGQGPSGALVQASDGNFYGTTASGGSTASIGSANSNCASANVYSGYSGCGTIYKITPTGIATVLYSFGSTPEDGTVPTGALLQASDGNLYGTTTAGGAANEGTVFKLILGAN